MSFPLVSTIPAKPTPACRVHSPTKVKSSPARANAIAEMVTGDDQNPPDSSSFNASNCCCVTPAFCADAITRSGLRARSNKVTPLINCSNPKKS